MWMPIFLLVAPKEIKSISLNILLAGTLTHSEDLAILLPALERVYRQYGDSVHFIFMGMGLSPVANLGDVELLSFEPNYHEYANQLCQLKIDMALVPLEDNPFNCAKSNIKWLEYSALGIPAIFSDLPPYACVEHGRTGLRVNNTEDAWFEAINSLIISPELRHQIGRSAQDEVLANWTLQKNVFVFRDVYSKLYHMNNHEPNPSKEIILDAGSYEEPLFFINKGNINGTGTAVMLHLYYQDLWPEFFTLLKAIPNPYDIYISLSDGREDVSADIMRDFPNAMVIRYPNRGLTLPLFAVAASSAGKQYDQLLFLHGKKSPTSRT
jgi:Lipopolysaccharide biosynthesis protein